MSSSSSDEGAAPALKALSLDYLNLLINGQAFADVAFSVDGRLVHAHRCVLAARSPFFRKLFCGIDAQQAPDRARDSAAAAVIPVSSIRYEAFVLVLQFLYSGQAAPVAARDAGPLPGCGARNCWHTRCGAAVDLALDTLAAARSLGADHLALLLQKQLEGMVKEASIDDVMKVLAASRKHDAPELWNACSHLLARSGLSAELLAKHLPIDIVAKIEELRSKAAPPLALRSPFLAHQFAADGAAGGSPGNEQRARRMRAALAAGDMELVKHMVMGEGLDLDEALAVHYAVQHCTRDVVKALLELGAADVNTRAGPSGKTPLHLAAEMVSPEMVSVLVDHHADPTARTVDGVTPLDVLRRLTSEFLFKGAVPGLAHIEPNKLRLCLELVQSAVMVATRADAAAAAGDADDSLVSLTMNSSRMVYGEQELVKGSSSDAGAGAAAPPPPMYFPHGFH